MLFTLHLQLATMATIFTLLLALWGFLRYMQGQGVDGSYLGAVVIGEGLLVVQGALGGLMMGAGAQPARPAIHILYGLVALLSFPALYAFTQGRDSRREMLLWALIALFVFGVTIRARLVA
ncbi:MAG: hypothetical protein H0T73_23095 [Ardenticatenales bacterium]|nr:hypothetical protein [Ardenticatenales bacterium]